jgi:predicted unusual protein kinase regulating ubiquinone biosynthesis (AarF/ABC1/UbiB family)
MKQSVPEGKLVRAGIAGATALKLGIGHLGHKVKRPFLSEPDRQEAREALDDKNARLLFDALSQLRGTALKAAQMLSMEIELLPEAYRRELEKSCHKVPPLNRVLVRKVLMEEFGKPPEALFARFDAEAFAAASLGQVHAAALHDGTEVAVKIQYPGIHVAIDSDMALMRQLARGMPNSRLLLHSLDEINARLHEEVDYRQEAANTLWFREQLAHDRIQVPQLIADRCSGRVLTTGFAEGLHLDAWLQTNPPQAARDQAGQQLYDLFVHSSRNLRWLHADPNPGNYLFRPDGSVTVIDFGCVKEISLRFAEPLPRVLKAYHDDDPEALFAVYRELGMPHRANSGRLYEEILRPFGRWLTEPLRHEHFDFAKHPDYTARGQPLIHRLSRLSDLDRLAAEFIFFNRTLYGLCKIFERMGASVRMRDRWFADPRYGAAFDTSRKGDSDEQSQAEDFRSRQEPSIDEPGNGFRGRETARALRRRQG